MVTERRATDRLPLKWGFKFTKWSGVPLHAAHFFIVHGGHRVPLIIILNGSKDRIDEG